MPPTTKLLDNDNFTDYFNNRLFTGFVTGVISTVMLFSIFRKK